MNRYKVYINAEVESRLSAKKLSSMLVIALHDIETGFSKLDGIDDDLEVMEYRDTEAEIMEKSKSPFKITNLKK